MAYIVLLIIQNREGAKMKLIIKLVSVTLMLATFSGCASLLHGTSQKIAIRSNDQTAEIFVNEAYIGKGRGFAILKKNKSYNITVRKEGCTEVTIPVTKSFDATTLLGVFIDSGIISILIVDGVITGAWQQFDPTKYIIDPNCAVD